MEDCIVWKNDEREMLLIETHYTTSEDIAEIQKWLLNEKGYYIMSLTIANDITFIKAVKANKSKLDNVEKPKKSNVTEPKILLC